MEMGGKKSRISGRQTMNLWHGKHQYPLDLLTGLNDFFLKSNKVFRHVS